VTARTTKILEDSCSDFGCRVCAPRRKAQDRYASRCEGRIDKRVALAAVLPLMAAVVELDGSRNPKRASLTEDEVEVLRTDASKGGVAPPGRDPLFHLYHVGKAHFREDLILAADSLP
jgi:hypothetical protein